MNTGGARMCGNLEHVLLWFVVRLPGLRYMLETLSTKMV